MEETLLFKQYAYYIIGLKKRMVCFHGRPWGKEGNDYDIEIENEEEQRDPRLSNQ